LSSECVRSSSVEAVRKGSHTSYKNRGRKDRQEELFPKLLAEIEDRRRNRVAMGMWSGEKRFGGEYLAEMAKLAGDKIGGSEAEQRRYFDQVLAKYPDCF